MPNQDDDRPRRDGPAPAEDPIYRNSLREAKIIMGMWVISLLYTCAYCYLAGYTSHPSDPSAAGSAVSAWFGPLESFDRQPDSLTTPLGLGIPDWVFYGVIVPWIACIVATFWFCLVIFREDDLSRGEETGPVDGKPATDGGRRHG